MPLTAAMTAVPSIRVDDAWFERGWFYGLFLDAFAASRPAIEAGGDDSVTPGVHILHKNLRFVHLFTRTWDAGSFSP